MNNENTTGKAIALIKEAAERKVDVVQPTGIARFNQVWQAGAENEALGKSEQGRGDVLLASVPLGVAGATGIELAKRLQGGRMSKKKLIRNSLLLGGTGYIGRGMSYDAGVESQKEYRKSKK